MSDAPPFSPVMALLTISRGWDASLTEALAPLGLTTRKLGLLGHINAAPAVSFSALARRSRITVQSAHTAVGALVAAGLVDDATAHAGSASALRLTDAGEDALARARAVVRDLDSALGEAQPELVIALRPAMGRMLNRD